MAGSDHRGIRAARNLSAATVAAIAAWSSYSHMVHVALAYGEPPQVAYTLPFSVDGMLIVATIVMVDDKHRVGRVRPTARLAFITGVAASIAANIAAAHPSPGARIVGAWPAIALLLVVEMLARPTTPEVPAAEPDRRAHPHQPSTAQPAPLQPPHPAELAGISKVPHQTHVPPRNRTLPNGQVPPRDEVPAVAEVPPPVEVPPTTEVPHQEETGLAEEVPHDRSVPDKGRPAVAAVTGPGRAQRSRALPATTARRRASADATPRTGRPDGESGRRPTAVTRQLAHEILDAEPDLPRAEVAARLGVSPRRLRAVLADPTS